MNRKEFKEEFARVYKLDCDAVNDLHSEGKFLGEKHRQEDFTREYYEYVPYARYPEYWESMWSMFRSIEKRYREKKNSKVTRSEIKFLDVGCGTGRIVHLANCFGFSAKGLEYHPPYVEKGNKVYGFADGILQVGDAFECNKRFLIEFNVIYTYMPIPNAAIMSRLHCHLVNTSFPTTIFAEMLPRYYPIDSMLDESTTEYDKMGHFRYYVGTPGIGR